MSDPGDDEAIGTLVALWYRALRATGLEELPSHIRKIAVTAPLGAIQSDAQ